MIHARTIDCLVERSDDITQAAIDLKWYRQYIVVVPLVMQAYLYSVRRVWAVLNWQVIVLCHIWTVSSAQADRCEPTLHSLHSRLQCWYETKR